MSSPKRLLCKACSHRIVMHAFATTYCRACNEKIVTGHIPGYVYCNKCATELNKCEQCGKDL